jgi:deoxyribodipyrimidine photolyase-related protein
VLDGLYWRFIERHRTFFLSNPRMSMMAHMLEKIPPGRYQDIKAKAEAFLDRTTTW